MRAALNLLLELRTLLTYEMESVEEDTFCTSPCPTQDAWPRDPKIFCLWTKIRWKRPNRPVVIQTPG